MAKENKPNKNPATGVWTYPSSTEVLEEVGLHTIEHYVKVRRETVARWIMERPIFSKCRDGGRKRGTSARRQFWWEQPMDLEPESETAEVSDDESDSVSGDDDE